MSASSQTQFIIVLCSSLLHFSQVNQNLLTKPCVLRSSGSLGIGHSAQGHWAEILRWGKCKNRLLMEIFYSVIFFKTYILNGRQNCMDRFMHVYFELDNPSSQLNKILHVWLILDFKNE